MPTNVHGQPRRTRPNDAEPVFRREVDLRPAPRQTTPRKCPHAHKREEITFVLRNQLAAHAPKSTRVATRDHKSTSPSRHHSPHKPPRSNIPETPSNTHLLHACPTTHSQNSNARIPKSPALSPHPPAPAIACCFVTPKAVRCLVPLRLTSSGRVDGSGGGVLAQPWRRGRTVRSVRPHNSPYPFSMVNRNLIREFDVSEEDWNAAIGDASPEDIDWLGGEDVNANQIVEGKVLRIDDDFVLVDVGYKSEGIIPRNEWEEGEELPQIGDTIRVLVEDVEDVAGRHDDRGMIVLSKRKAEKIEKWMKVMETVHEGDVVTGQVTRKIKGGLLVDIGVNVFLPASQVDIRRPHDIGEYIGKEIKCLVLKIDEARRNIVVSRRSLIEAERAKKKAELLKQLEVGQIRKGVVKNIADFGAFVDLGGIDGLLHITDMSWGRISHPSEMVQDRRPDRGDDPPHRLREGEDRPGPEAEDAPARGKTSPDEVPRRLDA